MRVGGVFRIRYTRLHVKSRHLVLLKKEALIAAAVARILAPSVPAVRPAGRMVLVAVWGLKVVCVFWLLGPG
jgi:hypothetical protein